MNTATTPTTTNATTRREIAEAIGRHIRLARRQRDWTQARLGRALGVGQASVARWETGEVEIGAARLIDVAQALDIRVFDLLRPRPPAAPRVSHPGGEARR